MSTKYTLVVNLKHHRLSGGASISRDLKRTINRIGLSDPIKKFALLGAQAIRDADYKHEIEHIEISRVRTELVARV